MKMNLRTLQHTEAVRRINELTRAFQLDPNIKNCFNEGKVFYSYITGEGIGSIGTIGDNECYVKVVKDFEKRTGGLVYHAIELGYTLALLYVSEDPEEWPYDRLERNHLFAFVYNFDCPECSEYGEIVVGQYGKSGVLTRVG